MAQPSPLEAVRRGVLITGATSGIGWKFAKLFALRGFDLVITGRDRERLERFQERYFGAGVKILAVEADLSEPKGVERLIASIAKKKRRIDVLVNNAGFGDHGPFAESELERQLAMISLNITALVRLTRHFLPAMIERGNGHLLNVASTAAFAPGPLMAMYYATKAFVLSFSQALSVELKGTGVSVSTLCPGATKTNFDVAAGITETRLFGRRVMEPEPVAAAGIKGLLSGKRLIIPGFSNWAMAAGSRIAPRGLVMRIVASLNSKR